MYLIYPIICLLGADIITRTRSLGQICYRLTLIGTILLSLSTCVQHVRSYGAPLMVWAHPMSGQVCLGREWYRFPSSFFLADNASLAYYEDGVTNQLPTQFTNTRVAPAHMNDQNREEISRYVPISSCDYAVDVNLTSDPLRPELQSWVPLTQIPERKMLFLDRARTQQPFRSLYFPVITEGYYHLVHYLALRNPNKPS